MNKAEEYHKKWLANKKDLRPRTEMMQDYADEQFKSRVNTIINKYEVEILELKSRDIIAIMRTVINDLNKLLKQ